MKAISSYLIVIFTLTVHFIFLSSFWKITLPEVEYDLTNLTYVDLSHFSENNNDEIQNSNEEYEEIINDQPELLDEKQEPIEEVIENIEDISLQPITEKVIPKKIEEKSIIKPIKKITNKQNKKPNNKISSNVSAITLPQHNAEYLNNKPPTYPATSRRLKEEGTVSLQVTVGVDGQALNVKLVKSSNFSRLDDSALNAVKKYKFKPAMQGGIPIKYTYTVNINFQLTGYK